MYGQRGNWQRTPDTWHSTNGYLGEQQHFMQQTRQNSRQQYEQQQMHHPPHPPPPSRQPYYPQMQHHHPPTNNIQMQQGSHQQPTGHTPNPRPHKRFRQETAVSGQLLSPPMQQLQQPAPHPRHVPNQQPAPPPGWHMQQQQQQYQQSPGGPAWRQPTHQQPAPPPQLQQLPQHQHQQLLPSAQMQQPMRHAPQQQQHPRGIPADAGALPEAAAEAAAPQYPSSNHGNPAAAAWLDSFQEQMLRFVQQVAPTPEEELHRHSSLTSFNTIVQQALPQHVGAMKVALFGSGAAGLAVHHSDLDVAVTGLATPDGDNGGFDDSTKQFVVKCLKRIDREATYGSGRHLLGVTSSKLVARARIPVLKLQLQCGLELDVSLNDAGGVKAARFLTSFQSDYPAIRPLILVLKAALKQRGLADVATGGLGSWSLANMVIAHLMEEDRAGYQADHVGSMLLSFLQRYGVDFHLDRQAVAVKGGGIVAKQLLGRNFTRKEGQLALEDPLTGREVAGGSHRYADVEEVFTRLHNRLAADLARHHQGGSSVAKVSNGNGSRHIRFYSDSTDLEGLDGYESDGYDASNRSPTYKAKMRGTQQQQRNSGFQLLGMILDCDAALDRDGGYVAAAGAVVNGAGRGGGGGRWQWGNGQGGRGPAPVVGRKRERW